MLLIEIKNKLNVPIDSEFYIQEYNLPQVIEILIGIKVVNIDNICF